MYTQCPDCEIAFKVTADVLKQAAGKVRCGSCGNAFNALAYLSEQMPKQPVAQEADADLPKLTPEIIETDSGLPRSISAEQSAALLKTLDELAGSDIRIEDTGVEWRVLDEQEAAAPAADDDDADLDAGPNANAQASSVDELRFDDNTPLPDDFDLDNESSYAPGPAFGVMDDVIEDDVTDAPMQEPRPEFGLSEPDEWTDILGEFEDLVEEVSTPIEVEFDAAEENDDGEEAIDEQLFEAPGDDQPLDMDTQFALQAEAMGIDLSGINEMEDEFVENLEVDLEGDVELEEEPAAVFEDEPEFEENTEEDEPEGESDEELEEEPEEELEQLDLIGDQDQQQELIDEPVVESHTIENELAGLDDDPLAAESSDSDSDDDSAKHYVPPMTEEEHTVNMQIDQDLMALAIEDKDGFASTIVIPAKYTGKKAHEEKNDSTVDEIEEDAETLDDMPGFETVIMEGEHIRSALDGDKLAADRAEAARLAELARVKEADEAGRSSGGRFGMIAGVVVLVLLLAVQVMHQSREALATIPAFSNTVGQVYRAIGQPVQPAWDITGWRFEATNGNTDGEEEELTVYSRLGNNSDGPLPYPLIGISLTDRFEETIGSRILDPAEYLPTDLDPRKLVEPGNTFNAVITIKSTSEDATGFKLNVCYRLSNGQLRCAIDDFK